MQFEYDARTRELIGAVNAFLAEKVYPAEPVFAAQEEASGWDRPAVIEELKTAARERGLWNLFLPGEHGAGLTNLQYAPLAELTGRSPHLAPEAFNCAAPDTGNMELLSQYGTPEQQDALAETVVGGADPLGVLHDRAGGGLLGRQQHRDPDRPRR